MSLDICFENVNFSYKRKNLILENINIEIKKGEFVGIVGPNGGGKTTFLKLVLGLLKPTSGKILVQNKKPRFSKRKGYVPHLDNIDMNFPISVLDVVLMGCLNQKRLSKGKCRAIGYEILEKMGIANIANNTLRSLSKGQFQRVMISRALISKPEILLLDEPTSNVDVHSQKNFFDVLKKINDEGITILVVSHDLRFISGYIKKVVCINKSIYCHPTSSLSLELIKKLYSDSVRIVRHDK